MSRRGTAASPVSRSRPFHYRLYPAKLVQTELRRRGRLARSATARGASRQDVASSLGLAEQPHPTRTPRAPLAAEQPLTDQMHCVQL